MTKTSAEIIEQLKKASEGLLLVSESEAPFEPFHWEDLKNSQINTETILQKTGRSKDTPIEVVDINTFFAVSTTEQDWQDSEEKAMVKRFQSLVSLLLNHLKDLKVYRLGKRNIDVYIVGKTPEGDLAGLATKVVET